MTAVKTKFLMGTENGPDGPKNTVLFQLEAGFSVLLLTRSEDITALANWVGSSPLFMDDIAQQAHGWTTPSTRPSQFDNLLEEQRELESIKGRL